MCRLDYIPIWRSVPIYADYSNLVYLFDPFSRNPRLARLTTNKLMRWALKPSAFRYVIEHVPGESKIWADMLTRWVVKATSKVVTLKNVSLKALLPAPVTPGLDGIFDWPSLTDIKNSQSNAKSKPPPRFHIRDGLWKNARGITWIPVEDNELNIRILVAAHTGRGGHCGLKTTRRIVSFHFEKIRKMYYVRRFLKSCIHCLRTKTGEIVRRHMRHALHTSAPNKLIHFYFCYMSKSYNDVQYVLIIKYDFCGHVWLVSTAEANTDSAVQELLRSFSSFGVVQTWVSDRGTHF